MWARLRHTFHCACSNTTPEKTALSMAAGLVLGVMPLPWGSCLLCALIGWRWQLNHALLQGINYALYPLQLALMFPFYYAGSRLFSTAPTLNRETLQLLLHAPWQVLPQLGRLTVAALLVWGVASLVLLPLAYRLLCAALRRRHTAHLVPPA